MAKIKPAIVKREPVTLDQDGIISEELQAVVHSPPTEAHIDRAAEAVGMDRALLPHCATVAELLAFVISVKAAAGDDKAITAILDRFSPKASRNATDVTINNGGGAPVASSDADEERATANYMASLSAVK